MLIVIILWSFVGYAFCNRYLKLDITGSIIGAFVAAFLITQIERQILLGDRANKFLKWTRVVIGILTAIIGSLIIDQILFKDDIEKNKLSWNQEQVEALMPARSKVIGDQVLQISDALAIKEIERKELSDDVNKNPTIRIVESVSSDVPMAQTVMDSITKISTVSTTLGKTVTRNVREVPNPKMERLQMVDVQIESLNKQKTIKQNELIQVRSVIEDELNKKIGFIDELNVMIRILIESPAALIVYFIWFVLLLFLELLILIGKSNDTESDYDKIIQKQMAIHLRKLELL